MKITKRILSIAMALCLCIIGTIPVSAVAETETEAATFDLPNDAVILYQDDDTVLYQSKSESDNAIVESIARTPVDYESVWLNKSEVGSFQIHNSRNGKVGITWKVESSSNDSHAQIYMTNSYGLVILTTYDVHPSDGDVYFKTTGNIGYYTVHYIAETTVGMRIMCWMYDV